MFLLLDGLDEVDDGFFDVLGCIFECIVGLQVELRDIVSALHGATEVVGPADVLLELGEGALRHLLCRRGLDAVIRA